jgi:hypothetical protein
VNRQRTSLKVPVDLKLAGARAILLFTAAT